MKAMKRRGSSPAMKAMKGRASSAMKAMKRRASSPAGGAPKKRAKVSLKSKCTQVARAINNLKTLAPAVRSVVTSKIGDAFGTYKDERHPYQVQIITMVNECLSTAQSNLQTAINEAEAKKASFEAEISSVVSANDAAVAAAQAASQTAEEKKTALADSKTALKNAKASLQQAEVTAKTGAAESAAVTTKKEQLEAFTSNILGPAKDGTIDPSLSKKGVTDFKQIGKLFSFEAQMVASVCSALGNKSENWGTFDRIVMKDAEDQLQSVLTDLNGKIAAAEPTAQQNVAAIETAKGAVAAAEAAEKAAEEADAAAKAAVKEANEAAKKAASDIKKFQPQINKSMKAVETAKADLEAFTAGPLAAFAELEAYSPPPPPPVEPEAPADAVAAPTEGAPAEFVAAPM